MLFCYCLNLFAILAKGIVRQNVNMLSDASTKLKQQTPPLVLAFLQAQKSTEENVVSLQCFLLIKCM